MTRQNAKHFSFLGCYRWCCCVCFVCLFVLSLFLFLCILALQFNLGNIHKLGRLLGHEWWTVTDKDKKARERYLFLFKSRILVCKVRRISEDRSVFILKDIIKVSYVTPKKHKNYLYFMHCIHLSATLLYWMLMLLPIYTHTICTKNISIHTLISKKNRR